MWREAGNGREAVERALQLTPDLIVLDLTMPEMNGAEAARVLKRLLPQIPITLFTVRKRKSYTPQYTCVAPWSRQRGSANTQLGGN